MEGNPNTVRGRDARQGGGEAKDPRWTVGGGANTSGVACRGVGSEPIQKHRDSRRERQERSSTEG